MKILDCTLRDGGYYTDWDFDKNLVNTYVEAFNDLPVEYLEIGYRSKPLEGYLGEYFYLPLYVIKQIKESTNKKLVIILNEKDVRASDVEELLGPCVGLVDMVRMAIDPKNIQRAIVLAKEVKKYGFEVGFNVMYMSTWKSQPDFLEYLPQVKGIADYFYMVDSFGGVYPEDVREIYNLVKSYVDVPIGFHGHNNLELALINTLTAIECGADMVDATVAGMGRGAGNLKTELLLTSLNSKTNLSVNFNSLSHVVDAFEQIRKKYEWGTNLPYMVSGAHSLPQKDVMEWVGKRYYSINSILRALHNQKEQIEDNAIFPILHLANRYDKVLIIGGGNSVIEHKDAIREFLKLNKNICVIHASSRNAQIVRDIAAEQIFCLVGNEGIRLEKVFVDLGDFKGQCVLPPYPRKMGTYVPEKVKNSVCQLQGITFTSEFKDTHTTLALQTCIELNAKEVFIAGYDGYKGEAVSQRDLELLAENEILFSEFTNFAGLQPVSLNPTQYKALKQKSIYSFLTTNND